LTGRNRSSSSVFHTLIALGCLVLAATCARTPLDSPVDPTGAAGKAGATGRAGAGAAGGRAGSGGAGAGGMTGVAGAGGMTGVAGAGGMTGVAGAGGMVVIPECPEGMARCSSMTTIQLCQDGQWGPTSNCSLLCLGGICAECVPEQIQCAGPTSLRTCNSRGLWPDPVLCASGSCDEMANHCTVVVADGGAPEAGGMCADGTSECFGTNQVRLCLGGMWATPFDCEHGCVGGVCAECRPGQTRCMGAQVCTAAGVWTGTPCEN
jgi:hypothetical protein